MDYGSFWADDETGQERIFREFKPERIMFVEALPKTRSAKIVRRAVRATALGQDPGDLSSLENPEALDTKADVTAAIQAAEQGAQIRGVVTLICLEEGGYSFNVEGVLPTELPTLLRLGAKEAERTLGAA